MLRDDGDEVSRKRNIESKDLDQGGGSSAGEQRGRAAGYGLAGPGTAEAAGGDDGGATAATRRASEAPPLPSVAKLRKAADTFSSLPSIYKRIKHGSQEDVALRQVVVPDWKTIQQEKQAPPRRHSLDGTGSKQETSTLKQSSQKVTKVAKQKGAHSGRTYTSKYRGVHQTFPTQRWEAQFRRNGKPTSLGCFDYEHEAARAYDKMMIWCELHQSGSMKGGVTNFDVSDYDDIIPMLRGMEQDELVMMLRRDGRTQAAQVSMATKAANLRQRDVMGGSRRTPSFSAATTQSGEEGVDSRYNAPHASP